MTNLAAIKAKLNFPLSDDAYTLALLDRGLVSTATYAVSDKQSLDLTWADLVYTLASTPNTTEGGYSISFSNRGDLLKAADGVYLKYGIRNPLRPIATFKSKM